VQNIVGGNWRAFRDLYGPLLRDAWTVPASREKFQSIFSASAGKLNLKLWRDMIRVYTAVSQPSQPLWFDCMPEKVQDPLRLRSCIKLASGQSSDGRRDTDFQFRIASERSLDSSECSTRQTTKLEMLRSNDGTPNRAPCNSQTYLAICVYMQPSCCAIPRMRIRWLRSTSYVSSLGLNATISVVCAAEVRFWEKVFSQPTRTQQRELSGAVKVNTFGGPFRFDVLANRKP